MNRTQSKICFVLWLLLSATISQSQSQRLEVRIDSAIANSPFKENYRYWGGSSPSDLTDFRMDTISGRLVSFHFKYFSSDTIVVNYYFVDNYLVKMESHKISKGKDHIVSGYYFDNEKLVSKHGRNLKIDRPGIFSKFSRRFIDRQLSYIYYQFEYFTIFKKRLPGPAPAILVGQRLKIDKQYQEQNIIRQ